jgi:two-component system nitrate/nitrite response regulator NarL
MFQFDDNEASENFSDSDSAFGLKTLKKIVRILKRLNINNDVSAFMSKSVLDFELFNELKIGVYIIDYNKSNYLYVNEALAGIVGIDQSTLMKSDIQILESIIHPADYNKVLLIVKKGMTMISKLSVKELENISFKLYYRIKCADGKYSWCMQMNKLISDEDKINLIDLGSIICLPGYSIKNQVIGYLTINNKQIEISESIKPQGLLTVLSRREIEIMIQVALGLSSKEISEIFGLSEQTVKIHRKHILQKLGVNSSIQAIRILEAERKNNKSLFR